jgi:hypothetical protein
MDEPAPYPIWDGVMSFRWDGRLWFQNDDVRFISEFSRYSQRKDDLYWSVNQCFLAPYYLGDGTILVAVAHTMPNLKTLEYRFDEDREWQSCEEMFTWKPDSGTHTVYIRAVNMFGKAGAASSLKIVKK